MNRGQRTSSTKLINKAKVNISEKNADNYRDELA